MTDAGIFGDILCGRMRQRQVAALVTDGALRDLAGILGLVIGGVFLAIVLFSPDGLLGLWARLRARLRRAPSVTSSVR